MKRRYYVTIYDYRGSCVATLEIRCVQKDLLDELELEMAEGDSAIITWVVIGDHDIDHYTAGARVMSDGHVEITEMSCQVERGEIG